MVRLILSFIGICVLFSGCGSQKSIIKQQVAFPIIQRQEPKKQDSNTESFKDTIEKITVSPEYGRYWQVRQKIMVNGREEIHEGHWVYYEKKEGSFKLDKTYISEKEVIRKKTIDELNNEK